MSRLARVFSGHLPFRALTALALVLLHQIAGAQPQSPPPPANFFSDTAGVVSADVSERLERRLREFEKAGGADAHEHQPESEGFFAEVKELWDDLRD